MQGICAFGIAIAVTNLEEKHLGMTIVILLALLAIARSVCSVSYKDVLGKTVDKSKRGTATGTAHSIAAGLVIIFAVVIASRTIEKMPLVIFGLALVSRWIFILFAQRSKRRI